MDAGPGEQLALFSFLGCQRPPVLGLDFSPFPRGCPLESARFSGKVTRSTRIVYYFSSRSLFVRSLSCSFQLLLRTALWGLVCFAPGIILTTVCSILGNVANSGIQQIPTWGGCGNFLVFPSLLRRMDLIYFPDAPLFRCPNRGWPGFGSKPVHTCIKLSILRMKKRKGSAFVLMLSFLGWALLCFFVIPALFVIPYFRMSRVTCAKWILIQDIREEYESLHTVPDSPSDSIEES